MLLVSADGRPNNLHTKVRFVISTDFKRELHEIKDDRGRDIVVKPAGPEMWMQVLDWEED